MVRHIPEAPFPYHLFVFHSDGSVLQSDPDAGDANTNDSNLMGAWIAEGDHIRGKLVETAADRATHKFVSRGEISFSLKVSGDVLNGPASVEFFDAANHPIRGPLQTTLTGRRIVP